MWIYKYGLYRDTFITFVNVLPPAEKFPIKSKKKSVK